MAGAATACRRILAMRARDPPAACLLQDAWAAMGALVQIDRVADALVDHESPMAVPDATPTFLMARGRFLQLFPAFSDAEHRQTLRQGRGTLTAGASHPEVDAPLTGGEPAPAGLRVVRVATLDEAFAALAEGKGATRPRPDSDS